MDSIRKILLALLAVTLVACGTGEKKDSLPDNFLQMTDAQRVEYLMGKMSPDSVAMMMVEMALGHVKGAKIDTLALATLYAYDNYQDKDIALFSDAFDSHVSSLPLDQKMDIYAQIGKADPQNMGLQLGLEYVADIRNKKMDVESVRKEIAMFKQKCGDDVDTYRRFVTGFKTALKLDRGKDFPEDVYKEFINMSEE